MKIKRRLTYCFFMLLTLGILSVHIQSVAFAAAPTGTVCCSEEISITLAVAGDVDLYCDDLDPVNTAPVHVDVQRFGRNFVRTIVSCQIGDTQAYVWVKSKKDTVEVYHSSDVGYSDAHAASEYTTFNTLKGALGVGLHEDCSNSSGYKQHKGYWGEQP